MAFAPDVIIRHARLWSDGHIHGEADALAVTGSLISAVGSSAALEAQRGPTTRMIDAGGATVTAGLCDAHVHLLRWAHSRGALSLRECATRDDAVAQVGQHAREHDALPVIVGRGWDSNAWADAPHRDALDGISVDRPVLLWAHDDHSLWVNSAALQAAGVVQSTRDPEGGRFERESTGRLTGIAREHAVRAFAELERGVPKRADADVLETAVKELHSLGVTAVHDFENARAMRALRAMTRTGTRVRVLMHLTHTGLDDALRCGIESGVGDDTFRIGGVKLFADGTLGSHTAAMLEPYDGTQETGMDLIARAELQELVRRAVGGGISVAIHAIGDRASRSALDAFAACRDGIRKLSIPPRIEHVQILDEADVARFGALGVVASMQPSHCVTDIATAQRYWHTRSRLTYPWRDLLERGAHMVFGSDAPIEPPDPAVGLHAALARQRPDGWPEGGYVPEQRITLDQALSAYTEGPARLDGRWPRGGRLAVGSHADVVIWETDLHMLPTPSLANIRPTATLFDGQIVFERSSGQSTSRGAGDQGSADVGVEV